jgi:hypothetical protein
LDDIGYPPPKSAVVKNKALESKSMARGNIAEVKREILGAAESRELVKSQFKLKMKK